MADDGDASPSYHKYDVTDYLDIDPEYGTLSDMRALVEDCHARDIRLIVDMPVNHTSTRHPWFLAACEALRAGDAGGAYVDYYNFNQTGGSGFVPLEDTGWYYEERFRGGGMPDMNLENPAVLEELRGIFDFWMNDVGVDGFRLDAVTSYFTDDAAKNVATLARLKAMAEELKPGSFLVGECWANLDTIAAYYASGVDSFFLFPSAQAEGFIAASMRDRRSPAKKFMTGYRKALDAIPDGLLTPFLCNHDTGRMVGLLGTLNGCVFTYYGEEAGMAGSGDDPNKRLAMPWGDGSMTDQPLGVTAVEYPYPPVLEQLEDEGSLACYVRAVNRARLEHPAIAWGENAFLLAEGNLLLMRRTAPQETCLIAVNFSAKQAGRIEVGPCSIAADLETGGEAAVLETAEDGVWLNVPARGIVVLEG